MADQIKSSWRFFNSTLLYVHPKNTLIIVLNLMLPTIKNDTVCLVMILLPSILNKCDLSQLKLGESEQPNDVKVISF